jgi:hypothetical protein
MYGMPLSYPERDRGDRTRPNPRLGEPRGYLGDWTTQQWVRRTGRRFQLRDA